MKFAVAALAIVALTACSGGGGSSVTGAGAVFGSSRLLGDMHFVLPSNVVRVCPDAQPFGYARCASLLRTDVRSDAAPSGYGPSDLQAAYNLPAKSRGANQTVAIVDAFDDPNAESDLGTYRSTYALPTCTTANGCFKKVNQRGAQGSYPAGNRAWALEISLDLDMVSAGCPKCKILLVEADENTSADLGVSVDEAVALGARIVSNSYTGGGDLESDYTHPGTVILASAGDRGYGIEEPAAFPSVVSAGGTSLYRGGSGRGWSETVWSGTGSGCTPYPKPAWQKQTGCRERVANDVSAVADPETGVAVYDSYGYGGFLVAGGTSASSPLLGAVYGLAENAARQTDAKSLWNPKNHEYLYDVTSGSNGTCSPLILCTGDVGWDGPSGWGTPDGVGAF